MGTSQQQGAPVSLGVTRGMSRESLGTAFHDALRVPLYLIAADGEMLARFSGQDPSVDIVSSSDAVYSDLMSHVDYLRGSDRMVSWGTAEELLFVSVPLSSRDGSFWLLGPIETLSFNSNAAPAIAERYGIKDERALADTLEYGMRRMSIRQLVDTGSLLFQIEWGRKPEDPLQAFSGLTENDMVLSGLPDPSCDDAPNEMRVIDGKVISHIVGNILEGDSARALEDLDRSGVPFSEHAKAFAELTGHYIPNAPSTHDEVRDSRMLLRVFASEIAEGVSASGFDSTVAWVLWYFYVQQGDEATSAYEINRILRRMICDFADRCTFSNLGSLSQPVLRAMEYIRDHLSESFSNADVADFVHMNARYLSDQFKRETGTTIKQYTMQERIVRAKMLLTYTDDSLISIAGLTGFASQSYFTSCFKESTGTTPQRYRERNSVLGRSV
jgi:AraC-like DNA-binding protein